MSGFKMLDGYKVNAGLEILINTVAKTKKVTLVAKLLRCKIMYLHFVKLHSAFEILLMPMLFPHLNNWLPWDFKWQFWNKIIKRLKAYWFFFFFFCRMPELKAFKDRDNLRTLSCRLFTTLRQRHRRFPNECKSDKAGLILFKKVQIH